MFKILAKITANDGRILKILKKAPLTKTLYLSYDGMTDALGQSQVLAYQRRIAHEGHHVHIVSFEKPKLFAQHEESIRQSLRNTQIFWHPLPYTYKPPIFSTLCDLYQGRKLILELQQEHHFDLVHCRGYVPSIWGLMLQKRGVPMIFDMRGWWPDEKKESGFWASWLYKPVYLYFKKLEAKFFREAKSIVSLTEVGKQEILHLGHGPEDRIGVIPTCVDFSHFTANSQKEKQAIRRQIGIPLDHQVLVYSGSLGGNYPLDAILEVYGQFSKAYPKSTFLVLTKNLDVPLEQEAAKQQIPWSEIKVFSLSYKEVPIYLKAGDVGMIYYTPSFSVIGRSPTKLGEYWACGLVAIAQKGVGDLDYLVSAYPKGLFLYGKDEGVTAAIQTLKSSEVSWDFLRSSAMEYFGLDRGVAFYKALYRKLIGQKNQID